MKLYLFLLTFFVSTMSFGKPIENTDPAYLCEVSSFKTKPTTKNYLRVGDEVIVYPVQNNLFKAYGISTSENFLFMILFGTSNLNEVTFLDGVLRVSVVKPGIKQIMVDEKSGKGTFVSIDSEPMVLFKPDPTYKVEFVGCKRIPHEDLQNQIDYVQMPERKPAP